MAVLSFCIMQCLLYTSKLCIFIMNIRKAKNENGMNSFKLTSNYSKAPRVASRELCITAHTHFPAPHQAPLWYKITAHARTKERIDPTERKTVADTSIRAS